jgi:AraC-like DNA-binding protein
LLLAGVSGSVVATEVGFFDQSHLARHFKRLCGMTPSAFVERTQKKARSAELDAGLSKRVAQNRPRAFAFDSAHAA